MTSPRPYTIRLATAADAIALRGLAEVDSKHELTGDVLVAEFDDGIAAAIAMDTGRAIANPFIRTAGLLEALRITRENHSRSGVRMSRRDRVLATLLRPSSTAASPA